MPSTERRGNFTTARIRVPHSVPLVTHGQLNALGILSECFKRMLNKPKELQKIYHTTPGAILSRTVGGALKQVLEPSRWQQTDLANLRVFKSSGFEPGWGWGILWTLWTTLCGYHRWGGLKCGSVFPIFQSHAFTSQLHSTCLEERHSKRSNPRTIKCI